MLLSLLLTVAVSSCLISFGWTENPSGTGGEEFDHTRERDFFAVNELLEAQRNGSFQAENSEGRAIEFDIFQRRFVWSVIGGNGVDCAVGESGD